MATTNTQTIVGVELSKLEVGDNGQIAIQAGTAAAANTNVASGITVAGKADVTADTAKQVGLLDSTVEVGSGGGLSVTEVSSVSAIGTSVADEAKAVSKYSGDTGGILNSGTAAATDIQIGAGGTVGVLVDNTATATSTSTGGKSDATASFNKGSYGALDTEFSAGAGGTISVNVDANASATANSIGPIGATGGPGNATALAEFAGPTAAIFSTGATTGDIKIGDAGTISALAGVSADPLSLSATAFTVSGLAKADATATTIAGIGADPGTGKNNIDIGAAGNITAAAVVSSLSSATTTTNDATPGAIAASAINSIGTLAGLGTGLGDVNVGTDATLTAVASSTSGATAISVDGLDKNTEATVGTDAVYGLNVDKLDVGNNASLTVSASSTQTAAATTVAANGGAAKDEAKAAVAGEDLIAGIHSTNIDIGKDSTKFTAGATLNGTATSSNINGALSDAVAGQASTVSAIWGDAAAKGVINIGNNLTSGLRADAIATLTATASNVDDKATASAGDKGSGGAGSIVVGIDTAPIDLGNNGNITSVANGTLTATATSVAGDTKSITGDTDSRVTGINKSDISIGQTGNLTALATGTLNSTATSTGGKAESSTTQTGTGFLDGKIDIGKEGNIAGQATLVGNATSTSIGPVAANTGDSKSTLSLDAAGINQAATFTTKIGDTGNVTGNAFASGNTVSQVTNGKASSDATFKSNGVVLADNTANLSIGGTGNVTGLGVVGTLNSSGNLAGQVQVTATAVGNDSDAKGAFTVNGIFSPAGATEAQIIAGPRDGDIIGQAIGGANLISTTVGDPTGAPGTSAKATLTNTATLAGIQDVNLIGGQVGQGSGTPNAIRGTAFGDFDAASTSVNGDANADSTVNAYGIFSDSTNLNDLSVNGGVTAIATLSNTVTATTVAGEAKAVATSSAIGISGYNINIIAGGTLTASASSNASTIANTVGGAV